MKLTKTLIALSNFYTMTAGLVAAPLDGYNIMIPEWEVEISLGRSTVRLNGTIQEVHEALLKLNPSWNEHYMKEMPQESSEVTQPADSFTLEKRADFSNDKYLCRGRWAECSASAASNGVHYLRFVQGWPTNGPGPGNCGRVSCSYKSAIRWCNDNASAKRLGGFNDIADGAQYILDKCTRNRWSGWQYGEFASGQAFHKDNWNVIVRYDDNSC
ncbi:hypothetical protein BDV27DRAFT_166013 [Aspergillus caelatus]|uniref:Uncharacterized protein n=1 Tax=Aspergillus caelatus TaxID=61420 RepID=A0A5N6ZYM2_9EURO|nr:uncharacterized protein BDV27DRAFT_166013 [Aspergillus caelatus]KAE8362694.1 hypothetical protein BDV27DRAFT_166013 [Aspergillus caelatus]